MTEPAAERMIRITPKTKEEPSLKSDPSAKKVRRITIFQKRITNLNEPDLPEKRETPTVKTSIKGMEIKA